MHNEPTRARATVGARPLKEIRVGFDRPPSVSSQGGPQGDFILFSSFAVFDREWIVSETLFVEAWSVRLTVSFQFVPHCA